MEKNDAVHLDTMFRRIRNQVNSGLPAQRKAALLLVAIDATVVEQSGNAMSDEPQPPLAYFGALITLLEQQLVNNNGSKNDDQNMTENEDESYADREEMVTAIMHLLAIVFTKISTQILRLKFSTVSQTLHQTLKSFNASSAATRDTLTCLECVFLAMDLATWSQSTTAMVGRPAVLKGLTQAVLQTTLDERPKVRKRAQDVVRKVLSFPPTPALVHPFMIVVVDHFCEVLNTAAAAAALLPEQVQRGQRRGKLRNQWLRKERLGPLLGGKVGGGDDKVRAAVGTLVDSVLSIGEAAGGNIVLMQWIFQVLSAVLTPQVKKTAPPNISLQTAHTILSKALSTLRPYHSDSSLAPLWLGLVDSCFSCTALIIERDMSDEVDVEAKKYAATAYAELIVEFFEKDFGSLLGVSNGKRVIIEKAVETYAAILQHGLLEFMVESATVRRREGVNVWAQVLAKILLVLQNAISNITFKENWGAILIIMESALERVGGVAPAMIDAIVTTLVSIRDSPNYSDDYPFKAELDSALEAAALSMGLERFTMVAPLNIFDAEESETKRPYLLSVFTRAMKRPSIASKSKFGPSNLNYFTETVLPLYTALHQRSADLKKKGLLHPSKLFDTLAFQAFSLLPAICGTQPGDLAETFDSLSPEVLSLLQSQSEELEVNDEGIMTENDLRPLIYAGLQSLVEGYTNISNELSEALTTVEDDDESPLIRQQKDDLEMAGQGLSKISNNVNKFLSILCTIYTTPPEWVLKTGDNKGSVLQGLQDRGQSALEGCIKALMGIADSKAVTGYFFQLVKNILQIQTSVKEQQITDGMEEDEKSETIAEIALMGLKVYSMLDLLCVLLIFLPEVKSLMEATAEEVEEFQVPSDSPLHLFYKLLSGQLRDRDATLQKKTYKALNLVMAVLPASQTPFRDLMPKLIDPEVISRTTSGVKRARMGLIQAVVDAAALKKSAEGEDDEDAMLLEFIPVVLLLKKARSAAYECLIAMGRKMLAIGLRRSRDAEWARSQLKDGEDEMEEEEREINFREYMMMVVAGLAGASSSMQSAAIACCGRLVFEFHDVMGEELVKEIVSTILLFMGSNNREIVKAALGFIKVAVVSIRQELLEDELENMITSMLTMAKPLKSHFKSKVKNALERTDSLKKAAAKAAKGDESDDETEAAQQAIKSKKTMQSRQKEFEDVLHGSEDEESDSDGDDDHYIPEQFRDAVQKKAGVGSKSMIREGEDIVDFLDSRVISNVTSARGGSSSASGSLKRKKGADFNMNDEGRIMIAESDEEASSAMKTLSTTDEPQEDYYKEALTGEGSYKRLPDGSVKFVTKRKRDDDEDIVAKTDRLNAGASNLGGRWGAKFDKKRKSVGIDDATKAKMLGGDYKSKRAKGDIKKAGAPDPFAYIPLSGKIVGSKKKSTELSKDYKDVLKASITGGAVRSNNQGGAGGRQGPRGIKKNNKKHK
ncbi:NUC173 domain-containing protein [Obelidium mucronatum]|nr:NUC173 domain-containing protein [Obelidium mucronatum]